MTTFKTKGYFSVSSELIVTEKALPYDLYVNSSTVPGRDHFVKIFPLGEILDKISLKTLKDKFHQFYLREEQRSLYLRGITGSNHLTKSEKSEVIKGAAIGHLQKIFDLEKEFSTEILVETVQACRESVECMVDVIQDYSIKDLYQMVAQLSFHDFYTYDHSVNVSMYCINLYLQLNPKAQKSEIVNAGLGGLLHDLGKLRIPTNIINKPDKLSDEEFEQIKKHPEFGNQLLMKGKEQYKAINIDTLARTILEHHENVNGTGYPNKLKGNEIHQMAKLTAIADFFDAITTHRSYHQALPLDKAIEVMKKSVGRKIDPDLFSVFLDVTGKMGSSVATMVELPDNFDPCQPQNFLPLIPSAVLDSTSAPQKNRPEKRTGENKHYGKVVSENGGWLDKMKRRK